MNLKKVTSFGDCYHNSTTTPADRARLQMAEFISSLKATGETSYQKGLCKAVEILNNQDSKTRHRSESINTKSIVQYLNHLTDLSIPMNCPCSPFAILWTYEFSIVLGFMVDLSSHGVTDEFQLGYHSDNIGDFFMQISASIIEKSILFNIVESMHDTVIQI